MQINFVVYRRVVTFSTFLKTLYSRAHNACTKEAKQTPIIAIAPFDTPRSPHITGLSGRIISEDTLNIMIEHNTNFVNSLLNVSGVLYDMQEQSDELHY